MTLSTRYLVDAGSTKPATRLIAIRKNPSTKMARRGRISAQTSGKTAQACLSFSNWLFSTVDWSLASDLVIDLVMDRRNCRPSFGAVNFTTILYRRLDA